MTDRMTDERRAKPHKCPKCGGFGWLQYDPTMPFVPASTSCGPWRCDVCVSGIIWETEIPLPKNMLGDDDEALADD